MDEKSMSKKVLCNVFKSKIGVEASQMGHLVNQN